MVVGRATMAHRPTRRAPSMGRTTPAGSTARVRALSHMAITATAPHRPPYTTIVLQGLGITGCAARIYHRNTVSPVMWCMTGVATGCTSHRVATTGCNMAGITCWWRLPRA